MSIEHTHIPVYLLSDAFRHFLKQFVSQGNPFTAGFHSTPLSQIGPFKMMTRGKHSSSIAHTKSSNKCFKSSKVANVPGPSTAKRSRSRAPVQAINQSGRHFPCQPLLPRWRRKFTKEKIDRSILFFLHLFIVCVKKTKRAASNLIK